MDPPLVSRLMAGPLSLDPPYNLEIARLHASQLAVAARSAFGAETGTAAGFARLLVILATTHFLLDAAAFNQLAETANGFLDRLLVS